MSTGTAPKSYVLNEEFKYAGITFPPGTRFAECSNKSDEKNIVFVVNGLEIEVVRGGRVHQAIQNRAS